MPSSLGLYEVRRDPLKVAHFKEDRWRPGPIHEHVVLSLAPAEGDNWVDAQRQLREKLRRWIDTDGGGVLTATSRECDADSHSGLARYAFSLAEEILHDRATHAIGLRPLPGP